MDHNKRRSARVEPDELEPIEIQIMSDNFLDVLYAKDVSETGVGIFADYDFESLNINNRLALVISIPPKHEFRAVGIIRYKKGDDSTKGYFGIEFTGISGGDQKILHDYIDKRLAEKRKHLRVKFDFQQQQSVHCAVGTAGRKQEVAIKDLSLGGAGIVVDPGLLGLDAGKEIDLDFSLPDGERLSVHGTIARKQEKPGLLGISFSRLSQKYQTKLKEFLKKTRA